MNTLVGSIARTLRPAGGWGPVSSMPSNVMSGDVMSEPTRPKISRSSYRPHLDGLRTVAVYLVVAFHAGLGLVSGGFIGVDIFFVLSGFLVTQILIRDLASVGRIRLRQFYSRRVRRILPAAAITLVVTALVYAIIASPAETRDALGGFKAAFLYFANWYFIRQSTDYFAANINTNPVVHFWSLAVEEQFYLVWPMLLAGLYFVTKRLGRPQWWALRIVVAVGAVASAIAALHIGSTNLDRAYYGTDTRAYQLLAGAALALTPQLFHWGARNRRYARALAVVVFVGMLALATSALDVSPITRGVFVAVLAVALIAALENTSGGVVERLLSSTPFTYLGRISYGIYLWHWPVIVIAAHGRSLSPLALFAISCGVATPLAALSFHLIEHPIRAAQTLDRFKTPIVAFGLATSVLCGVVAMPAILDRGTTAVSALPGSGGSASGLRLLDWRVAQKDIPALPDCLAADVSKCTVVAGTGLHVVLMGDSNARMWIPAFSAIAKQRGWNLSVLAYPTCPWQQHLDVVYKSFNQCQAHHDDWYNRVIPEIDPGLVVLAHQAFDDPLYPYPFIAADGSQVRPGNPKFESSLTSASAQSLTALSAPGRQIAILEPIPDAPPKQDPLACLSKGVPAAKCAYQAHTQPTPLELFYRKEAKLLPGVASVDLDRVVCPRWPTCDAIIGDVIVKRDANHLTATFAKSVAAQVEARMPKTK